MHADLVHEPVHWLARGSHMIAATELVLVSDGVDNRIQAVNIRADANRLLFYAGINFWNGLDLRVDGFCSAIDFAKKLGEGINSEGDPLAKIRVREITEL